MALAVDATSSGTNVTAQTAGNTTTVSHVITSATVLVVSISAWDNGGVGTGCSGVTYNGIAMTAVGNSTGSTGTSTGSFYTEQWYLLAPATGTHNIVATVAGKTDKLGLSGISFSGGSTVTAIDVSSKTFGTSGTYLAGVTTTVASEYLVDCISHLSTNSPSSHTGTQIYTDAASSTSTGSQYSAAAPAGNISMNWVYPDVGDEAAYSVLAVKAVSGSMNAPTFVASYRSVYNTFTTPKTLSVTTQPGDLVVVYAGADSGGTPSIATPSGNGITFTLYQSVLVDSTWCLAYIWAGVDNTGGTNWTLTDTINTGGINWGFSCLVFRNSGGVGASNKDNQDGFAPTMALTTTQDNSAVVVFANDWNGLDGTSRTWETVNSITPTNGNGLERDYAGFAGLYENYGAYYNNVGSAGPKTVGLTAPAGQKYSMVALEVKGQAFTGVNIVWLMA